MLGLCKKRRRPAWPAVFQAASDLDLEEGGQPADASRPSRLSPDVRRDIFLADDPGGDGIYDNEDLDAWSRKALENWRQSSRKQDVDCDDEGQVLQWDDLPVYDPQGDSEPLFLIPGVGCVGSTLRSGHRRARFP